MKLTEQQQQMVEDNERLIYGVIHKLHLDIDEWYDILAIELCKAVYYWNKDKGTLSTFYYRIAINKVKQEWRKSKAKKRYLETNVLPLHDDWVDCYYDNTEDVIFVNELLESEYGDLLKLIYQGYTQREISEILNTSQPNISRMIKKARKKYDR